MSNVLRSEFLKAEVQINKQSKKLTRAFYLKKIVLILIFFNSYSDRIQYKVLSTTAFCLFNSRQQKITRIVTKKGKLLV